ncbi:hypothetical protein GT039_31065 [Streptomyces sp. SID2955]|nr:hypothetical protein [Streptomyces sp. SID2955]
MSKATVIRRLAMWAGVTALAAGAAVLPVNALAGPSGSTAAADDRGVGRGTGAHDEPTPRPAPAPAPEPPPAKSPPPADRAGTAGPPGA